MWPRQAGVLLHPTSLPGPHGLGDVGPEARSFADWLARAGVKLWQVLPLGPPGGTLQNNPYVSWSPLAGNPLLVSLHDLHEAGLLERGELEGPSFPAHSVDFARVRAFKSDRTRLAADRLLRAPAHPLHGALQDFRARARWAQDTGLFAALKAQQGGTHWWAWPEPLRRCDPASLLSARRELAAEIDCTVTEQFLFEHQWRSLRGYCRERGIRILGDVPIYLTHDSCDVWMHQDHFRLLESGMPEFVGGAPPDVFSARGQRWGCPTYDWERMARDDYAWWRARLARALEHADCVRLDHFRAFSAHWEIPASAQTAAAGRWVQGPGLRFFETARRHLGDLPLCAEDLGTIDADVETLLAATGFPGMRILHYAFDGDGKSTHLPHNHVENCIVYPGNHDNDTTVGWWSSRPPHERSTVQRYLGRHGDDISWDLIRAALASVASVAAIQLQDVLALPGDARMNDPTSYGLPFDQQRNWRWRALPGALSDWHAERLRHLCELYGRA
ncbi:MAG TPA: 4-alpha-glucanotransferase [Myxococcales bacterium]